MNTKLTVQAAPGPRVVGHGALVTWKSATERPDSLMLNPDTVGPCLALVSVKFMGLLVPQTPLLSQVSLPKGRLVADSFKPFAAKTGAAMAQIRASNKATRVTSFVVLTAA
jgi:hypothetical protein